MPRCAGCSRVQEASHGTCSVHEPGARSPALLSPDHGHGAASGGVDVGPPLAPLGGVLRRGAGGPAAVSPAAASWSWWSAARVCRGFPVAGGPAADTVAPVLSRGP